MTGEERVEGPLPQQRRLPLLERFPPQAPRYAETLAAHDAAIEAGQDGYLDPASGLFVFTAAHHWQRGRCCRSGCRHCPFEPGARPEPGQPRPGTE